MSRLGRKLLVSSLAVGLLMAGTGLLNAPAADAATGQGNHSQMGVRAGIGGQNQFNMWLQFGPPMQQQHQMRSDQQQPNQMRFNQQPNQMPPNQQQHNQMPSDQQQLNQMWFNQQQQPNGQFAQSGRMFGAVGGNIISQVADILDVDEQDILDELKDGRTLVEIAEDYDVDEEELLEQLEGLQTEAIEAAADAGAITDDQADDLLDNLAERLEQIVEGTFTHDN